MYIYTHTLRQTPPSDPSDRPQAPRPRAPGRRAYIVIYY